jgi:putative ABC transport system permease protein
MSNFPQDIKYAARTFRKNPGFAAVVVIILAVGIGANVAMFSITDAVMFRSLPYPDSDNLILGRTTYNGDPAWNVSSEDYYDYRDQVQAFESLAATRSFSHPVTVTGGEEPERVPWNLASIDFFPTLGVAPLLGRNFTVEEAELGAPDVAIISYGYWQRRYGGSPGAVGSTIVINAEPATIVGVMPAGFFFLNEVDIWEPMRAGGESTGYRQYHNWTVIGRLAPGMSLEQAQSQVDVVSAQLQEAYPESNSNKGLRLRRYQDELIAFYRPMLLMLLAAIALVLLIACGNVAGLLLARASIRTTEMSVRAALGASGSRLMQQLMTESALLALVAGVVGVVFAIWLQGVMLQFIPLDYLGITEIGLSGSVLVFAVTLSVATALVFGVAPAVSGARANPAENLKSGVRTTGGGATARLRSGLVVLQVALSVVLLVGAGLLLRSFVQLQGVDPGFNESQLLTGRLGLSADYSDGEARVQFYTGLLDDIRAIPGVQAVGATSLLPIKDSYSNIQAWDPENPPVDRSAAQLAEHRRVLPGYFAAMEIPLLSGRDVQATDDQDGELVLIINRAMARGLFQEQDPIGKLVAVDWGMDEPALLRVVGVVGDVRMYSLSSDPDWQMYYSYRQSPSYTMSLAVRTHGDAAALTRSVRDVLRARDPNIPLADIVTMEDALSNSLSGTRVIMLTLTLFAAVALFLAAIGLYSVLAFYVARRMHEIGIRLALGASAGRVLQLVLQRGLGLVGTGLVVGVLGAVGVTRFIQQQLFGVEPTDPATFAGVCLLFALVGAAACMIPAWRAVRLDPVKTLQVE